MSVVADQGPGSGWKAELELGFERQGVRTVLARRTHRGPLLVQKPFYPEGPDRCHVYVLHPPAGVAGGDALRLDLTLEVGSSALVTTPGAAKFYRSDGRPATVSQNFSVGEGAALEWLPQETIVYDGALAGLETVVDLAPGALFAGWEVVCLGLPASKAPFASGCFTQGLRVTSQGRPVLCDRCRFEGGSDLLGAFWGLGGACVSGLFVATLGENPPELELPRTEDCVFTRVEGLLVGRYLGDQAWKARERFTAAWNAWRVATAGSQAHAPRIWNT